MPAPIVFSDVNYLSTTAPPSAQEWSSFLRPLRGKHLIRAQGRLHEFTRGEPLLLGSLLYPNLSSCHLFFT